MRMYVIPTRENPVQFSPVMPMVVEIQHHHALSRGMQMTRDSFAWFTSTKMVISFMFWYFCSLISR